jgi:hypothetical protein
MDNPYRDKSLDRRGLLGLDCDLDYTLNINWSIKMKIKLPLILIIVVTICVTTFADNNFYHKKLGLAYEGKIDTLPFKIGSKGNEIIKKYGKPKEEGFFDGAYFITYEKTTYFLNWSTDDKYGEVLSIGVGRGFKLFGIKVGMPIKNIQKILGKIDHTSPPSLNKEDEEGGTIWKFQYDLDKFILEFTSEVKNGPTNSAFLYLKKP